MSEKEGVATRELYARLHASDVSIPTVGAGLSSRVRSSLCIQFKPQHIAAGAVFLAAKALNSNISSTPSLFQEFQTTSSIIQDVVKQLIEVYSW